MRALAAITATLLVVPGAAQGARAHNKHQLLGARPHVGSLTADHIADPLGIDSSQPLLGWVITSRGRGISQTAYQIRVAILNKDLLRGHQLVWNTERVHAAQSFDVPYGGQPLRPRTRYYWQVRVWDNHGGVSSWSRPAWFETAFLSPLQFQGSWIGQYPDSQQGSASKGELYFRKDFSLPRCHSRNRCISRARLYVAGLSYPYAYVNGHSVSNHFLDTAFTAFNKSVDYTTYDVTRLVRAGRTNAVGLSLGHGFYAGGADDYPSSGEVWQPTQPKLKLELDIRYANGALTRITSDTRWKVATGPTTVESPAAETYDARLEKPGWNRPGYHDRGWATASAVSAPAGVLRAQLIPPILETAKIHPAAVTQPNASAKVYDFRVTTSGWTRITLRGAAGTTVYIEYSEKLNSDGTVQSEGNGSAGQTDVYVLKGGGSETDEPRYGWKGYRYVEVTTTPPSASNSVPVTGTPAPSPPSSASSTPLPQILSITGVVAHTALPPTGDFHSSSSLLNAMHVAMVNTILNNQYSYGSDTPTYEKGGWTGDLGYYSTSAIDNFGAESYYDHTMQNFDDSQYSNGNIGWRVPTPNTSIDSGIDPLWGGEFLMIEYDMFMAYDDLAVVRRDYSHMAAYMNLLESQIASSNDIYTGTTFGDWSVPADGNPPSSQLIGSMFLYREAKDLAQMAAAIGNTADAVKYDQLAASIQAAVNAKFYDASTHQYKDPPGTQSSAVGGPFGVTPECEAIPTPGSTVVCLGYDQTANAVGLAFGLAPRQEREAVAAGLAADAASKGDRLSTGAAGSKYILPSLTEGGHGGEAFRVVTNPTAPGWGHWFLECGATTMWETWDDATCMSARSRDHAFMGTVDDWLFEDVAGIQATSPSFRTVQIKPYPVGDLASASAYETSPLGRVSSSWSRVANRFRLVVQVPVGSHASVFVPAASATSVTEARRPVGRVRGVTVVGAQGSYLELLVGSGTYRFQSMT